MKKRSRSLKKKISELLSDLDWMFDTGMYDRVLVFAKEDHEEGAEASVELDNTYRQLTVKVYPSFANLTPKKQRASLVHEMVHKIMGPSKLAMNDMLKGKMVTPDQVRRINEEQTSAVTNILDAFLRDGMKFAKKAYKKYLN